MSDSCDIKYIFVIGRRPEELSTETISTLKGIRATRISLIERKSIEAIVRQSEQKGGIKWSNEAVDCVWKWTGGHAFFTQLLCSVVWERVREKTAGTVESERAEMTDVESAVGHTLKQGANAFHWIWDGLPPAERVIVAAIAEAEGTSIDQEGIEQLLNRSGVRLVVRQLKLAPEVLIDWEIICPTEQGYSFRVPLLRQWVRANRPLRRVKDELDRLDPLADGLFRTGQTFYRLGKVADAESQLRQSLQVNPNHLNSRLLLGRLLLEGGKAEESVRFLEEAYLYDSASAQADLVRSLLGLAERQSEEEALKTLERILVVHAGQPTASDRRASILDGRRKREWPILLETAHSAEAREDWQSAASVYTGLIQNYPEKKEELIRYAENALREADLLTKYNQAVGALRWTPSVGQRIEEIKL